MKTKDFFFSLPEELIAQNPSAERGGARLFVLDRESGERRHDMVANLERYVEQGTVMVFNDSRVRKARLYGVTERDGKQREFLLLRRHPDSSWEALTKGARSLKGEEAIAFPDGMKARSEKGADGELMLRFDPELDEAYLEKNGHVPLPPYIRRSDSGSDSERYQTVYAKEPGSSAAPTAGLHFTAELLAKLAAQGIETRFVTLHVGLGTFLPVRSDDIEDHRMHEEEFLIPEETAEAVERAKREGGKVLAVGTTSLRSLESAWDEGRGSLRRGWSKTDIFITPGYRFKAVDRLFTNFHTPESTLLMLVSAFAGRELIRQAYEEAIEKRYRFFSYGDAMLIQ
jgi:S-adenosylmethionine:tRNA ribosyltransferase-isomerase